jgi:aspartyl-tRNA(Asn)/glutamyl-tRNA(Gln) amidotransferase subunit C
MRISAEQVRQVAALARLGLREDELEPLRAELEAILGYVEQLAELDLTGVEGTSHAVPLDCPEREDRSRPSEAAARIVATAPQRQGELFVVPRIIPD